MADNETFQITEREIREAELQMTGRPPASATGFIGFVAAAPGSPHVSAGSSESNGASSPSDKG